MSRPRRSTAGRSKPNSRSERPERTYVTGPVTRGIRAVSLVGILAIAGWVAVMYPSLPETVPTHVNFAGEVDAFGARSSIIRLSAVMLGSAALIAWLSTKPRMLNYVAEITEQNAQFVYREGERMMVWLLVPVGAVYLGFVLEALGHGGVTLIVLGLIALAAITPVSLVRMSAASAKRESMPDDRG